MCKLKSGTYFSESLYFAVNSGNLNVPHATDNPKAQTFFSQWKILFGEVCGYEIDRPSGRIRKLAEFYQIGIKGPKPAELLFAVHTYALGLFRQPDFVIRGLAIGEKGNS